jgi:hypothetical protein
MGATHKPQPPESPISEKKSYPITPPSPSSVGYVPEPQSPGLESPLESPQRKPNLALLRRATVAVPSAGPAANLAKLTTAFAGFSQKKASERLVDAQGEILGGLDRDLKQKQLERYDSIVEKEVRQWVTQLGETLDEDLHECLRSGVVLCNLMNKIQPGSIANVKKGKMPFLMIENINSYLKACAEIVGLPSTSIFQTVDLYEEKNMTAVILNLHAVGRLCNRIPGYKGPYIFTK